VNQRDTTYAKWSAIAGGLFVVAALAIQYWPAPESVKWLSFREAKEEALRLNKPIFMDVFAEWCAPCKMMDRQVFPNDSVKSILSTRYVAAKINGDDGLEGDSIRMRMGVKAYPTYIVLSPSGKERKRFVGFVPTATLVRWLSDSAGVQLLQWPDMAKARQIAVDQKRKIMVLILQSGDDIEAANQLVGDEGIADAIDKHFVPTLLVRGNVGEEKLLQQVGASPKTGMREVIILDTGGKEIGRFFISMRMQFDPPLLIAKLLELASK